MSTSDCSYLSSHISYAEAVKSTTARRLGIDNTPDSDTCQRMRLVAVEVFEPLRKHFGIAIGISSFYRSRDLNLAIGGSVSSQHCKGEAMDIDGDIYGLISNTDIFNWIKDNLQFDQLIWEFGNPDGSPSWVHVSYKAEGNRMQVLRSYHDKHGNTIYEPYKA